LVQELHEAGSKAAEAYAFCSVIPEATDKRQFTPLSSNFFDFFNSMKVFRRLYCWQFSARAGISEEKAFAVIETARSSIGVSFIRADEPLKMSLHVLRLTNGSKVADRLLDGGLETQTITEFYGEYGTGKSQICH
jgi:hypothetical protein